MSKLKPYSLGLFIIAIGLICCFIVTGLITNNFNEKQTIVREVVDIPISNDNTQEAPSMEANKLPRFIFDISDDKFNEIITTAGDINNLIKAKIIHSVYADEKINSSVSVDKENKKLLIKPDSIPRFKPGLYRLSLQLRTLEGEVNLEQDFTWGVIAVNTNKSVYKPGDKVKIGIGVLNNSGETLCLTGFNHVDSINLIITDPNGEPTNFSTSDSSIRDSEKCGPTSITNEADFQSDYQPSISGIYQITVNAIVRGEKRQVTDYFKVDSNTEFDVERTSFPTRIYPKAIYPVTLTITSSKDYEGKITDVVPAFFNIDHIGDGGKLEKFGDFTKIIWNTKLTAGKAKTFTYFIQFPLVSPEFYLIGPIKIGSFTENRQWQIASDAINSTSGVTAYEDNATQNTWYRIWSGTAFGAQTSMSSGANTPTNSKWFREVSSPKTGEKLVAVLDSDTTDVYYVYRWTGSAWVQDLRFGITPATLNTSEAFDIAYEELSGDALFVYSDGVNAQLLYRYYTASSHTWGAATNAGTAYDVYKRWVRLRPQFDSDTILVGYQNNNQRIGAMIWDGSTNTFGSQFADNVGSQTQTSGSRPVRSFEAVYETSSGTPMIFWGTTSNNIVYREFVSGSWSAEITAATGFTNDIAWLAAAADPSPTSNYIAIGTQEVTTPTCKMGVWNGSGLTMDGVSYPCRSAAVQRLVDVAFENTNSIAMWAINTSTASATTKMSWLTWNPTSGFSALTAEAGDSGNLESVQLTSDLNTRSMIALYVDAAGDLWNREWNGSTWTAKPGTAIHTNIQGTGETCEAYGFGFDRNLESQVAYKWFANSGTVAVSSALTAQDTPYTLTTENQQFRLRLLMFTPDTLTASLRNYKLQYVDPGSGTCAAPTGGTPSTWTDVPTSGGTTISFYNNSTPADGATLTANAGLDPTYRGLTKNPQTYEEANNFTNSVSSVPADQLGLWDFSLIDNTTYDRVAQTFCFRIARSNDVVLQIGLYPQVSTAALPDVIIQGGTLIQGGVRINN
jgi:hypothetical protein